MGKLKMYKVIIDTYIYIHYEMTTTIGLVNTSINSQNCHFFLLSFFFKKLHTVFYGDWTNLHSCQQSQWFTFLHIFANTYLFDKSHSNRDEIILFVALIWISLVIHDVETFSYISQPFVCLLWKKIYLNSLPIYKSDFFFFIYI